MKKLKYRILSSQKMITAQGTQHLVVKQVSLFPNGFYQGKNTVKRVLSHVKEGFTCLEVDVQQGWVGIQILNELPGGYTKLIIRDENGSCSEYVSAILESGVLEDLTLIHTSRYTPFYFGLYTKLMAANLNTFHLEHALVYIPLMDLYSIPCRRLIVKNVGSAFTSYFWEDDYTFRIVSDKLCMLLKDKTYVDIQILYGNGIRSAAFVDKLIRDFPRKLIFAQLGLGSEQQARIEEYVCLNIGFALIHDKLPADLIRRIDTFLY